MDRECQTENYRYCEIHSNNMANDDYEMETVNSRSNLYPEIRSQNNEPGVSSSLLKFLGT